MENKKNLANSLENKNQPVNLLSEQKTSEKLGQALDLLSPSSREVLQQMGYHTLTPIQQASIPHLLGHKDFIGQSQTGSGKTAAFSLPLIEKINLRSDEIQGLILCPTRELCTQVAREIRQLGRHLPQLRVVVLCGGVPVPPQIQALQKGAQIIVGTPGRVLDHLRRKRLDFFELKMLVLDEADRMLDMGFSEDMDEILSQTPGTRQTVFFSATFDDQLKSMSGHFQIDPVIVKIDSSEAHRPRIEQFYVLDQEEKFSSSNLGKISNLKKILLEHPDSQALIFCNLKKTVQELSDELVRSGYSSAGISSDYEQIERESRLAMFKNGSLRYLIATDVAARGIDIEDLPLVINFDFPEDNESYVHRIGRTGRAGKGGVAISFASHKDKLDFIELENLTQQKMLPWSTGKSSETKPPPPKWKTFFLSAGRKQKIRPGDLQGWLTGEKIGLTSSEVGKFELFDDYGFIAVKRDISSQKTSQILAGEFKGREFRVIEMDVQTKLQSLLPPRARNTFRKNNLSPRRN